MDGENTAPPDLDHRRIAEPDGPHVAVVDIGSNSVRLVVYDALSRAPFPRFNEKSFCRLGASQDAEGRLSDDAIAHTLRSVERFFAISRAMGAERIDVLATEAVRRAPNGHVLIEGIAKRCGAETRLLEGAEEARFSALGIVSGFYRPHGLMGDIGGGSLELAEVLEDRVGDRMASLPLGALPVSALMEEGAGTAKRHVDAVLAEGLPPLLTEPVFYLVGGGWRALARIEIARRETPSRMPHGFTMEAGEMRKLAKEIAKLSPDEIAAIPDAPSRRAGTLAASALVLDRVLKALKPEQVVFSALGLREGWLYSLLDEKTRRLDPLLEGAQLFGAARARVPAFAEALVRWTDGLFPGESEADRRLRLAACALSDIAWRNHANFRAGEIYRRVLHLPFVGILHEERVFLATALHARHAGKSDDPVIGGAREMLPDALLRRARILGRALQLGYRLSGSVPEILDGARLEVGASSVAVDLSGFDTLPDGDAVEERLGRLARALGLTDYEIRRS